jgi:hypothetical protein
MNKTIEGIEKEIKRLKYSNIPQKAINLVDRKFSEYGYLKSLLEIKKEEEEYL